jgi:predicted metal-dependent HD superfamily phosphohydrolase
MIRTLLSKPVEVEFAIWFHDCIYDTHDDKNEEKSASYAYDVAHDDAKMDDIFCLKVHDLIIATKHTSIPDEHDVKYFLDIDLSILGADSHAYEKYRMNIRKEYRWIDENEYRVGRREVLNKFLNRDNIYLTDHFRGKYEKAARKNIENELKIN